MNLKSYSLDVCLSCFALFLLSAQLPAQRQTFDSLMPPKTNSPKATLNSFRESINSEYRKIKEQGFARVRRAGGIALNHAYRCLDLSKIAANARKQKGVESVVLLSEILDRIPLPNETPATEDDLPDENSLELNKQTRWRVSGTEIVISQVQEGPRKGEWLFDAETIDRLPDLYEAIKSQPYKKGTALENVYHLYLIAPGPMIPFQWIRGLPSWMHNIIGGQAVWKWIATGLFLLLFALIIRFLYRFGRPKADSNQPASFLSRLVFPLFGCMFSRVATAIVMNEIRVGGTIGMVLMVTFTVLYYLLLIWLILLVTNQIANRIIESPRIASQGIDAHMIQSVFRLLSVAAGIVLCLVCTQELGIPITPVLASLGVGGLAVALAAQNTLENLLGGIILFLDRPIRVGDMCRFGETLGKVEEVGLRATRLRTLDDSVITIPNSSFAKMNLENLNRRTKFWYHPHIQLRQDTTADQIRVILIEVRKVLYAHPRVDPEPARIRFSGFGEYSVDLGIFAYVHASDYGEFLGVAEDLNLRVMEIIEQVGAKLAAPPRWNVTSQEENTDSAKNATEQVTEWKKEGKLYLPAFPEDEISKLQGTIDFPLDTKPND